MQSVFMEDLRTCRRREFCNRGLNHCNQALQKQQSLPKEVLITVIKPFTTSNPSPRSLNHCYKAHQKQKPPPEVLPPAIKTT
ncbi:hypothetical protein AAV98_16770 [Bacillus sp. CHD6a]|nr:hypothetical protein AAV98_16770 [Bacillus sp. CHD6a]